MIANRHQTVVLQLNSLSVVPCSDTQSHTQAQIQSHCNHYAVQYNAQQRTQPIQILRYATK